MSAYFVLYAANDAGHDYAPLRRTLERLGASQLMEELWLVESDLDLKALVTALFTDRPPSDRFLVMDLTPAFAWSAANLMIDARAMVSALTSARRKAAGGRSVKVFHPGELPRELNARAGTAPARSAAPIPTGAAAG